MYNVVQILPIRGGAAIRGDSWVSLIREEELTFPEHHLNEVIHTATDGRNGLFAPLLSRLRFAAIRRQFVAIRGDSWRFAAIRGDWWRFAN